MENQIVSYDTALLAKEKGFNIPVIQYYTPKKYCTESDDYMTERYVESDWNNGYGSYPTLPEKVSCSAPIQSLLQKWLREKHNLYTNAVPCEFPPETIFYVPQLINLKGGDELLKLVDNPLDMEEDYSFEQGLEISLQEALKRIK